MSSSKLHYEHRNHNKNKNFMGDTGSEDFGEDKINYEPDLELTRVEIESTELFRASCMLRYFSVCVNGITPIVKTEEMKDAVTIYTRKEEVKPVNY